MRFKGFIPQFLGSKICGNSPKVEAEGNRIILVINLQHVGDLESWKARKVTQMRIKIHLSYFKLNNYTIPASLIFYQQMMQKS